MELYYRRLKVGETVNERKNLSSRCSSRVCQHAHKSVNQKELFIVAYILEYMEYTGCIQRQAQTGKLEGCNNKTKVAKRMGYGFRDDDYFFLLIQFLSVAPKVP